MAEGEPKSPIQYSLFNDKFTLDSMLQMNLQLFIDKKFITTLSEEEQDIIFQYTSNGDAFMNRLLRKQDKMWIYKISANNYLLLYFYKLCPAFLDIVGDRYRVTKPNENRRQKYNSFTWDNYKINFKRIKMYYTQVVPQLKEQLKKGDEVALPWFRELTYNRVKLLYSIFEKKPPYTSVITSYRGVHKFYLHEHPYKAFQFSSFYSTTINLEIAAGYTKGPIRKLYRYKIHPNAKALYVDSVSAFSGEWEILLAPGSRYVYLKEHTVDMETNFMKGKTIIKTYAVLPSKNFTLPETYTEFAAMKNEGEVIPPTIRANGGGKGKRKTINKKQIKRKTYRIKKQKGGDGNENGENNVEKIIGLENGENNKERWLEIPIITKEEDLDKEDKEMLEEILRQIND